MKKYILVLFILHVSTKSFCQKTVFIEKYDMPAEKKKAGQVIVEMPFGYIDCYQLCLVMAVYSNSLVEKIEKIKTDPGFPKS